MPQYRVTTADLKSVVASRPPGVRGVPPATRVTADRLEGAPALRSHGSHRRRVASPTPPLREVQGLRGRNQPPRPPTRDSGATAGRTYGPACARSRISPLPRTARTSIELAPGRRLDGGRSIEKRWPPPDA